jgi:hypothetical protein
LSPLPSGIPPELKEEISNWLENWRFTRFVTLATNDSSMSSARLPTSRLPYTKLRDRLRQWDARMNRKLLGKCWAKHAQDRIFRFYFLEKMDTNPHWHGLVCFFPVKNKSCAEQEHIFDTKAGPFWKKLVPSGTVDVKPITAQRGVAKYVAKMLGHELSYEHYVVPGELVRG